MKKILIFLTLITVCLSNGYTGQSDDPKSIEKSESVSISDPLDLPNGIYMLCCIDGELHLYNLLGVLVGIGPDCGGLEGCVRVIICSQPICDNGCGENNPADEDDILDLLKTITLTTGDSYDFGEGPFDEYCFVK